MKVLAPELSALITIFLSVGPVISTLQHTSRQHTNSCLQSEATRIIPLEMSGFVTWRQTHRRSSRPGPGGAHAQAGDERTSAVSGRKVSALPYHQSISTIPTEQKVKLGVKQLLSRSTRNRDRDSPCPIPPGPSSGSRGVPFVAYRMSYGGWRGSLRLLE